MVRFIFESFEIIFYVIQNYSNKRPRRIRGFFLCNVYVEVCFFTKKLELLDFPQLGLPSWGKPLFPNLVTTKSTPKVQVY